MKAKVFGLNVYAYEHFLLFQKPKNKNIFHICSRYTHTVKVFKSTKLSNILRQPKFACYWPSSWPVLPARPLNVTMTIQTKQVNKIRKIQLFLCSIVFLQIIKIFNNQTCPPMDFFNMNWSLIRGGGMMYSAIV